HDPLRSDPGSDVERLRLLADATMHAVVIHDRGRVLDMNDRFCEMFECTPEQARELDVLQYIRPVEGDRVIGLVDPEAVVTQRLIVTSPSGRVREIEGAGRPIVYRGQPCRVVSLLDVTARLQAERAVRDSERVMRERL